MATNVIYIVLRFQLHLRTAQQIRTGGKRKRPEFTWAEKIPLNQPFTQLEDSNNVYEVVELEAADGARWKTKLVHSRSFEEDIRISSHSPIKDVAQQHLADEVRRHIGELKQADIKMEGAPKSLWRLQS
jgi:hypothetical protein